MLLPTLRVYRNLRSNQGFLWPVSLCKHLRNSLETGLFRPGATSLGNGCSRLLNSTRLGPGAEHEGRAADYPESREGYRESAHKDYPGCAALASSNCAYPYVR